MNDVEFEERLKLEYLYWQKVDEAKRRERREKCKKLLPWLVFVNAILWVFYTWEGR